MIDWLWPFLAGIGVGIVVALFIIVWLVKSTQAAEHRNLIEQAQQGKQMLEDPMAGAVVGNNKPGP